MFKRDLRINFGILDELCVVLYKYNQELDYMQESINRLDRVLEQAEGETIEALKSKKNNILKNVERYKEQVHDLLVLISNYINDMTYYICPEERWKIMQVDRNDIWANMTSIEWTANDFSYSDLYTYGGDETLKVNMQSIKAGITPLKRKLKDKVSDLWDIYDRKVKPYEDTDDSYESKARELTNKYSTPIEKFTNTILDGFTAYIKFHWGADCALINFMINGMNQLFYMHNGIYIGLYVLIFEREQIKIEIDQYKSILYDPMLIFEGIGQQVTDTVEEKGIFYSAGYVSCEVAIAIILKKLMSSGPVDDVIEGSAGADDIYANKGYATGEDWNNYFKDKYGAGNVSWKPNSLDDIIQYPERLYGATASEVKSMLGEGWTEGTYGSNGKGWKFTSSDGSVFYHAGGGVHGGSYYGFSTGPTGKVKIIKSIDNYIPTVVDGATVIQID